MEPNLKKQLIKESNPLRSKFFIGKKGIDENLIKAIDDYLLVHSLVKIKIQMTSDRDLILNLAQQLISRISNSEIVQIKGFTVVLYKKI